MYDGWTPTEKVKLANAPEMRALCDELLRRGHKDAAIALDNAIDLIREAIAQEFTDASESDLDAQAEWHSEQKFGEPVHA